MVDPGRLKTIVFDVDGTLYKQAPLRRAMLFRLLGELVSSPRSGVRALRALRAYRHAQEVLRDSEVEGPLGAAQLRIACEQSGQTRLAVEEIVGRWMEREPLPLLDRYVEPALRPLLQAARGKGLRLGVLSDYPAEAKLAAMRLTEFFDVVVSAQDADVNRFKPHPSGLAHALRLLRAAPEEALYVGDRHDVDAPVAQALGVPCVIVGGRRSSNPSASWISVNDYADLHAMLFSSDSSRSQPTP